VQKKKFGIELDGRSWDELLKSTAQKKQGISIS
jgi:hypothetical protein